ncbi:Yip1 family protein [Alkalilimnicola ehrlichii MLHE-1]|uniref:Yip1 domain-containing protein n=1 Tax=Alkalilimnicola ehrlichii (strain ATCC BAA-1101 / DSM 17681 / MLHE-1) TaxID=187272 RepID=Q0A9J2_ALKEH|nr:Yip1 family protein [Alkalilimnicola ehrlichii]ABI56495.1 hypothetical protein Mlg_1146 [Alkalilimnicola ehrlichii MLHE-1]
MKPFSTLLYGLLLNPVRTLRRGGEAPPPSWQRSLFQLILPWIGFSVFTSQTLYQIIPTGLPPEGVPHPIGFGIYSFIILTIACLGLAGAAHWLAELFQGRSDFERALQAVGYAMIPAWVGNIAAAFPWPYGNGIGLALIVYSLILLLPAFAIVLGIRRGNRLGHYVATLICAALITFVLGWLLIDLIPGAKPEVRFGTTWLI